MSSSVAATATAREMGDLFGVALVPHNRWGGSKLLREKWQSHLDAALFRPVLVVDEAQEMQTSVLNELRLLCSTRLDSHLLLTTVLAGDGRLLERLRTDELLPLGSRMRVRLPLERASTDEMIAHKSGRARRRTAPRARAPTRQGLTQRSQPPNGARCTAGLFSTSLLALVRRRASAP